MKKRIFGLVLAVIMMLTFNIVASAETTVQPRYNYTTLNSASLSVTSLQAACSAKVNGTSQVTKIEMEMILQKKGLFGWNKVTSWSTVVNGRICSLEKNYGPVDSGTYRVYVEATVYVGTASEKVTATSSQVKV